MERPPGTQVRWPTTEGTKGHARGHREANWRRTALEKVRRQNTLPPSHIKNDAPRGHGIALANVRARLALLHDVQGEFTAGVQDGLYQVRITLPVEAPMRRALQAQRAAKGRRKPSTTPRTASPSTPPKAP